MRIPLPCAVLFAAALASCGRASPPTADRAQPPDAQVKQLADAYVAAFLERNPDLYTYFGIPGGRHDRLADNSLAAQRTWEAKEDAWLREVRAVDAGAIEDRSLRATYAILREILEGAIGARVCRSELWNISQMTGWQVSYGYLITIQPVGTPELREQALARWRAFPRFVDTEIDNAREGLRLKYTAPKLNVRIVIGQIDALIGGREGDAPFLSPALRDKDPEFARTYRQLYAGELVPAFKRYREFLEKDYLPATREDIAVTANPDGLACYAASIRLFSTLPAQPREVHETGLREIDSLMAEMKAIGEQSFQTADVPALLQKLRSDPRYLFKGRQELIAYSQAALARARAAAPSWFGLLPKADVRVEPYPKFREKNASNEYNAPAEDGSRPGLFYINAYQAEKKSRSPAESTAFHETVPGHHLQMAIALERKDAHPISRYTFNSGFTEGWGLYAERLADDMKLYSSDLDRIGMLSSQAFRAARLVVDSGIHTMGWSRQQAIDYMLTHTSEASDDIAAEVDRYIIYPGQATAYMLGKLQIQSLREEARQAMGPRFDVKAFHDRVLEDGSVPLGFLAQKIRAWSGAAPATK
jgi:uncharacterized protein (DUF885 family)